MCDVLGCTQPGLITIERQFLCLACADAYLKELRSAISRAAYLAR